MKHKPDYLWEKVLQETIFPDLLRGRKNFDLPHTKAVVYWIKKICDAESQLDKKVLVTAAYAHDWGYIDMGIDASFTQVHDAKEQHMKVGAERIEELLRNQLADDFTEKQIVRVKHLVFVHDRLDQIKDEEEIALMEADTMGALDTDLVKPTFNQQDGKRYIQEQVLKIRRPLFKHSVAIQWFDFLLKKRLDFHQITL